MTTGARHYVETVLKAGAALVGKLNLTGAAKGATVAADATATAQGADHTGLDVELRDASGAGATIGTSGGLEVEEQLTPAYEDDARGVAAVAPRIAIGTPYSSVLLGASIGSAAATVRATPGQVTGLQVKNGNAAVRFVCIVDKVTTPAQNDAVLWCAEIPATTTSMVFGRDLLGPNGVYCTTGVSIAFCTSLGGTTSAPLVGVLGTNSDHDAILNGSL